MFSWLTELLKNFSQWRKGFKRRRFYRKRRAPVVGVPVPHEKIGKVKNCSGFSRERQSRTIKNIMFIIIGVIIVIAVVAAVVIASAVKSADGIKWDGLDEFMGKEENVSQPETVSQLEEKPEHEDSLLTVVNEDSPLPEQWSPVLLQVGNVSLDAKAASDLEQMLSAAEAEGIKLYFTEGYMTEEERENIYNEKLRYYYGQGYSKVLAEASALPYAKEHCEFRIGLSVRLAVSSQEDFFESEAYEWLSMNASDYGFIFRYPDGKRSETGMDTDLTVLRYVGKEHALQMRRMEMCLEEYIEYVSSR